jgi:hypothetical protein
MSREAMQLALELIEPIAHNSTDDPRGKAYEAITALRQALETEQEPFEYWNAVEGWVKIDEVREHFDAVGCGTIYKSAGEGRSPLYTAPPKKQWVSLTDQEVWQAIDNVLEGGGWLDVARVLEQAFKDKNT